VGLFLLASRSDEGTTSVVNRPPPVAQSATGGESTLPTKAPKRQTGRPAPKPKAPAPTIERIVVRGGKPVGGVKRLAYERGERVRFSVQTDAADEVHIHGFDIEKALPANRRVRFGFPANIEGVFEVELHGTHTKIAELRIKP
jgi:hypothetical protein